MTRRPSIPAAIKRQVLYDCAYVCVICQKCTIQIHHIDKNSSNNTPENLVALCQEHHGEAHTKRDLTISLTAIDIRNAKVKWTKEVRQQRAKAATACYQRRAAGDFLGMGVSWGYINHGRIASMLTKEMLSRVTQENFATCKNRGLVDAQGMIIPQQVSRKPSSYIQGSIYDQFSHGDDHRVHRLYSEIVDLISISSDAVHVADSSWTKSWVRQFIVPGRFIFLNRRHAFSKIDESDRNVTRLARSKKRKISYEYLVETKDMFGTSSMTVSFKGVAKCAALLLVKSIDDTGSDLTVHCTPIALGAGYWSLDIHSTETA